MKKSKLFFAICALTASASLFASSALEFLYLPASPADHIFGGNPCVKASGEVFFNPALGCEATRPKISASAVLWIENIRVDQFCLNFPFFGGFSASGMYRSVSYGKIAGYGMLDNSLGNVVPSSTLGGLSFSRRLRGFQLGAGFLKIRESLSSMDSGSVSALSFGLKKKILFFDFAASVFMPSGKMKYGAPSSEQVVPKIKRIGVAAEFSRFLLEAGFVSGDSGLSGCIYGLSAKFGQMKIMAGSNSVLPASGAVFGAEFDLGNIFIGYSFSPALWGNSVQSLSVSVRFGPSNLKRRLLKQGKRFFNTGYYEKARKKFEEVLILDPDNVSARFFIAKISEILSPSGVSPTKE
ncbi:MAG: tetratricopeptide repeat protein [Elusimicrobia bacterium]|nr:tetratricopeptide repeat protein [Elusimicrobiota bacterium]